MPDHAVLDAALALMHELGPDALTFARLSQACGLSAATLVQRFRTMTELRQRALLHAWDHLDETTAGLAADMPPTPTGAVEILVALSAGFHGAEAYANGLLLLREDFRDPALRARGVAWHAALSQALEHCFAGTPGAPSGMGRLMAAQWQGTLTWWAFDPRDAVTDHVRDEMRRFVAAMSAGMTPSHEVSTPG